MSSDGKFLCVRQTVKSNGRKREIENEGRKATTNIEWWILLLVHSFLSFLAVVLEAGNKN